MYISTTTTNKLIFAIVFYLPTFSTNSTTTCKFKEKIVFSSDEIISNKTADATQKIHSSIWTVESKQMMM
jgi:hypothetical protein